MHTGAMVVRSGSHALVGICLEQMQGSTLDSVLLSAAESAMKAAVVLQMLREVRFQAAAPVCKVHAFGRHASALPGMAPKLQPHLSSSQPDLHAPA